MDNTYYEEVLSKLSKRTIEYFSENLELNIDKEFSIIEVDKVDYLDVTTLITFKGDLSATVGMSVSNELSYTMLEKAMFGELSKEQLESLSSENVAETLNIILGNILIDLEVVKKGGFVDISIPHTMTQTTTITKKEDGVMYLSILKIEDKEIFLSYFI